MMSSRAKYAIKALFVIAERGEAVPTQTREVADRIGAPRHFMESILLELKGAGFLAGVRGRAGGYYLKRPPEQVTFAAIIRAIDGPIALSACASRNFYKPCDDCIDVATCVVRRTLLATRDAAAAVLEKATLAEPWPAEA